MSRQIALFIFCILSIQQIQANSNAEAFWQKANSYYEQKAYDSAVYYYSKVKLTHDNSAELCYNIANSYYRLNDIGKAILFYEKALKYNPSDKRISDNLYLANGRINNRIQGVPQIFFVRWWRAITQSTNSNIYAVLSLCVFLIVIVYHILRRVGRTKIYIPIQATIASIVLVLLLATLGIVSGKRMIGTDLAVVIQEGSPLMNQPQLGKSQSLIPAGTKIELTKTQKEWVEVILPDGRVGWLQKVDVEKI